MYQKKQSGFTLVELGVVLAIATILATSFIRTTEERTAANFAQSEGVTLAQLGSATLQYMLEGGADGVFNDTLFLKRAGACAGGTAALEFLPCGFNDARRNGIAYTVTINSPNATITSPAPVIDGVSRPDMAAEITLAANGAVIDTDIGGFTNYTVTFPGDGSVVGRLDVVAGRDGLTTLLDGEYLRRDGTNTPTANLDLGGFDIANAGNIAALSGSFTGAVRAGSIGHVGGGELTVSSPTSFDDGITVAGVTELNGFLDSNAGADFDGGNTTMDNPIIENMFALRNTIQFSGVVNSSTFVPFPACNGLAPNIYVTPSLVTHENTVETISGINARAELEVNGWTVYLDVNVDGIWYTQANDSQYAKLKVSTRCV